jgi:hypothetical protein
MTQFTFQLFCLDVDTADERFLDRLYEAGCSDATVFFKDGYVCLSFARRAQSAERAVVTAIRDFERAGIGGVVERVEPDDLASLAEIAKRIGVTRASLQKYARGASKVGRDFPGPVQNLSSPRRELFSTAEIMRWMLSRRRACIPAESLELFQAVANTNRALAVAKAQKDEAVRRLVAQLASDRAILSTNRGAGSRSKRL